ncbi:unnamed protein product [Urochloa humidicola]
MEENMTPPQRLAVGLDTAALRGPSARGSLQLAAGLRRSSPRFRPTLLATVSPRGPSPPLANGLHHSRSPRGRTVEAPARGASRLSRTSMAFPTSAVVVRSPGAERRDRCASARAEQRCAPAVVRWSHGRGLSGAAGQRNDAAASGAAGGATRPGRPLSCFPATLPGLPLAALQARRREPLPQLAVLQGRRANRRRAQQAAPPSGRAQKSTPSSRLLHHCSSLGRPRAQGRSPRRMLVRSGGGSRREDRPPS